MHVVDLSLSFNFFSCTIDQWRKQFVLSSSIDASIWWMNWPLFSLVPSFPLPHSHWTEAALILPSSYSSLRQYNASLDIRSNLRSRYPRDPRFDRSKEYCVVFEVVRARKGCESSDQKANVKLTAGSTVCVSCASAAMRKHLGYRCHGHGIDDTLTRFSSVASNNCHGQWKRRGQYELCPCHGDAHADFIFIWLHYSLLCPSQDAFDTLLFFDSSRMPCETILSH